MRIVCGIRAKSESINGEATTTTNTHPQIRFHVI